ncbi:MAG: hypothetical protein ACK5G7_02180 [Erysipelotrichaceae bacterium]
MSQLILLIIISGFAGVYALLYYLNKNTPVPAGCENLTTDCDGCKMVDCEHHINMKEGK